MKRSFKVATVFTGAAACAAAFAPTALAAPAAPGATAKVTPDIVGGDCPTNPFSSNNLLHLYYTPSEQHSLAACFGGKGIYTIGKGKYFSYYCAGQYSGHLWVNGVKKVFTAGTHHFTGSVSKVSISKSPHPYNSSCGNYG
jgi:hypothetical protein